MALYVLRPVTGKGHRSQVWTCFRYLSMADFTNILPRVVRILSSVLQEAGE